MNRPRARRMDIESLTRRVVDGVVWLAATKAIGQAIAWLITIVVVRLLSPQDYGLLGMAALFTGFLILFNDLGLGAAIIQDPDLDADHLANVRWAIFLINLALFVIVSATAPLVAVYFEEPALVTIIRVLAVAFVINGIGSPSGYVLARELAFRKKSQAEFFGSLSGGVSTLALAMSGVGVWSLVAGMLIQQLTTNTLYCVYQPFTIARKFSIRRIRRSIRFGFQVASASVLWYVSSNVDFAVVGKVLGKAQLGYYSLAFQFSSLPIERIVSVLIQVAFPSFSALQKDGDALRQFYLKFIGTIALITFPMFLGLFLIADDAVALFLTAKWQPAVLPLKILCVVSCLRAIETMNGPMVLATGRARIVVLNNLLQAIVLPISFYVGAGYGIEGVAFAWLIAWPVLYLIVTSQVLRLVGLTFGSYVRSLRHPCAGSVAMFGAVWLMRTYVLGGASPAVGLMAAAVLGCVVYIGYNLIFNREAIREAMALLRPRRTTRAPSETGPEIAVNAAPAESRLIG